MAEKNNTNIGFENKYGMLPACCGGIYQPQSIARLSSD